MSNYIVKYKIWLFKLFFPKYVEVRISRSVYDGPFNFEITRVDCIYDFVYGCLEEGTLLKKGNPFEMGLPLKERTS